MPKFSLLVHAVVVFLGRVDHYLKEKGTLKADQNKFHWFVSCICAELWFVDNEKTLWHKSRMHYFFDFFFFSFKRSPLMAYQNFQGAKGKVYLNGHTIIPTFLQQQLPFPRRFYPSENWLRSRCAVITRELAYLSWYKSLLVTICFMSKKNKGNKMIS